MRVIFILGWTIPLRPYKSLFVGSSVCVFSAEVTLGSLLSLDTSLLISFNQPIMYCQPHSGILIGTLSQATLLPPPMSPHVENPHTLNWRNRESQVTTLFRFFLPLLWKLTGRPCLFFSFPSRVFPISSLSRLFPLRSPFLQSMIFCGRSWTTASWFRARSEVGGRRQGPQGLRWPLCRSSGPSFTNISICTSTNTRISTPSRPSLPVCPRQPSLGRPLHLPWCVPQPEMWG